MSALEAVATNEAETRDDEKPAWPLSFQLRLDLLPLGQKRWWSHTLYRDPEDEPVRVLYSKTKADSENLAQQFLDEPVLGFDMEWPVFPKTERLQEKIGLIQIACEDKIALFHIGLHTGTTTEHLIPPSLQKIIESPIIAKTGVSVLGADFGRLRRFFGLKPQGAFELSHLHRLVSHANKPEMITTKLVKLSYQVERHLGLPLSKGPVRTSNWSRPLNQQQIHYAAADAYAGYMLFQRMNAKRLEMVPTPPLPIFADKYPITKSNFRPLQLLPLEEGGSNTTIAEFFGLGKDKEDAKEPQDQPEVDVKATGKAKTKRERPRKEKEILDSFSQALYNELSARRKELAANECVPAYRIASNAVLGALSQQRPLDDDTMILVKGIGKKQQEKYGAEWLQVIASFLSSNNIEDFEPANGISLTATMPVLDAQTTALPSTRTHGAKRRRISEFAELVDSESSSPAFGTPPPRTPVLHTGISFTMAETNLDSEGDENEDEFDDDSELEEDVSDDGSSSVYATPPSMPTSQLNRKRSPTPEREADTPIAQPTPEPLSFEMKLFRSKLLAFSKLVSRNLKPPPLTPIVTEWTLDQIVSTKPRTEKELSMIPGIDSFVEACKRSGKDLLFHINKFAPAN